MPEKTPRDPQPAPHDLILESRARLTVTGVQKVLHCNADSAAMETGKGTLHLTGAQLNMAALDLETGRRSSPAASTRWNIRPAHRRAVSCAACCDDPGTAACSPWAGDRCLHGAGSQYRRTAGCIPGQRACSFCAGSGVDGCCAGRCAELRSRAEQCRCSALVHGCGSLCRCRCSSLCAGCTAACSGRRFTAPGAPAGRAAARPAEKGAQTTPQRKKNCKKAQKELAKPAPHDV